MRLASLICLVLATVALTPATAQPASVPPEQKAGQVFSFLSGQWRGPAWAQVGPARYEFIQTERVAPHLDGTILLVEGRAEGEADPRAKFFHALGIISFNPAKSSFEFRTYSGGRSGTFPARLVNGDTMVWEIAGAGGTRTRYTHRVTGNRWEGKGEFSRDGTSWSEIFGMTLVRTGKASFEATLKP